MSSSPRSRRLRAPLVSLVVGATVMAATTASANGINAPAPQEPVMIAEPQPQRAFPSIFGVNSAFPPPGGTAYAAITFVNPRDGISGSDYDGELSFGYVIGSPIDNVSLTLQANITGLDPFGDSGNFDISLARAISVTDTSLTMIGVSAGNLGAFGGATVDDEVFSVYVSHLLDVEIGNGSLPVQYTLGYGTDATRPSNGTGVLEDGFFYGMGVGITPNLSLSVSGNATQFNLGGTMTFDGVPGVSLSGGIYDVIDATNRQQMAITAAFSF